MLLSLALVGLAKADFIPPCVLPEGVVSVPLESVPPALTQALREQFGEIVAPGEKFDATDIIIVRKNRRFIFFWNIGKKWIVATEHGGLGYNDPIFVYQLGEGDRAAVLTKREIAFPNTVCAVASSLLVSP